MLNKHVKEGDMGTELAKPSRTACVGRVVLVLVPLVVLAATGHQVLQQRVEEQLGLFTESYRRAPLSEETRQTIVEQVDGAFEPVYAAIPEFLDWHYSFLGQYTELGLVLLGRLEGEIESRLFGGLEEGIGAASEDVGRVMQEEMLKELDRWFDRDVASIPSGLRAGYGRMVESMLADAKRRFTLSVGPTALGSAMAGVGTSVAVRALATKLAERLASGAAIRATGSLLGRSAALIVAAAAGVAIDFALRRIDEARNRDKLEQALTVMVDEEKENVKAALTSAANEVKARALGCAFR